MRRATAFTVWLCISAMGSAPVVVCADPHDEGTAAGRAALPVSRGSINPSAASANVPGYTTSAPEQRLYRTPNLAAEANRRLALCAATPNDPACEAQAGAMTSATTARPVIGPYDPAVAAARDITRNPGLALGDLSTYYAGCTTSTVTEAPTTRSQLCQRYVGIGNLSCSRTLTVDVARATNCNDGEWFAHVADGAVGLDAQCLAGRSTSNQHFRLTQGGNPLAYFDVNMDAPVSLPTLVAVTGTHFGPDGVLIHDGVWVTANRCSGSACTLTVTEAPDLVTSCVTPCRDCDPVCSSSSPFIDDRAPCAPGTQSGDNIAKTHCTPDDGCTTSYLDATKCYAPSGVPTSLAGHDVTGAVAGDYWTVAADRPATGWHLDPALASLPTLTLSYTRPAETVAQTDRWDDQCPSLAGGRCTVVEGPTCVDGPASKVIDGATLERPCWQFQTTMACTSGAALDQCAPLAAAGCTLQATTCQRSDPATGACQVFQARYDCPTPGRTYTTASHCPSNVFCFQGQCFNIGSAPNADFARASSMMEAAREAGVYLDTDRLQVFRGEAATCRDRLLKNCCYSDAAGSGMTNQSVFGFGSRLVFDLLMNSQNREFVYYGLQALLTDAGFSGAYSSFGFTLAVNGTALPSGSTVLYASSSTAGEGVVVAFDPWSLAITAVIYVVTSMMSCNEGEARLALKSGAHLCHEIGTWCSSCVRILGHCVSCIEHTTSRCCFNSMLARIINEQGRAQLRKGWGAAESPDCSGFTIAQLQSLDFARMDFSEFYASLVPTIPDTGRLQSGNAARLPTCYYGEGKCGP